MQEVEKRDRMRKKVKLHILDVINKKGITQKELAQKLNLSPSTVNDLCKKDIKRVNTETLAKIAEMFDIDDIRELITIENINEFKKDS